MRKSKQRVRARAPRASSAVIEKDVPIARIHRDARVRPREAINDPVVSDYCDRMQEGEVFPPLDVVHDGNVYWLVDGYHRLEAALRCEAKVLRCRIRKGSLRDAILASAGVNGTHGLRRTSADKRWAVSKLLQDREWSKWSDREIARRCHVGPDLVGRLREELRPVTIGNDSERRTYRTKHGTEAVMNITAIRAGRTAKSDSVRIVSQAADQDKPEMVSLASHMSPIEAREAEVLNMTAALEGWQQQFHDALRQMEKASEVVGRYASIMRGPNPSANLTLVKRLGAVRRVIERAETSIVRIQSGHPFGGRHFQDVPPASTTAERLR